MKFRFFKRKDNHTSKPGESAAVCVNIGNNSENLNDENSLSSQSDPPSKQEFSCSKCQSLFSNTEDLKEHTALHHSCEEVDKKRTNDVLDTETASSVKRPRLSSDTTRPRRYQANWKVEFPWLLYDELLNKLFCQSCRSVYGSEVYPDDRVRKKYSSGTFVLGCQNFKHSSLVGHDLSEGHRLANVYSLNNPPVTSDIKVPKSDSSAQLDELDKLFRNAHAIVKHNKSFSDYCWMIDLDEKKDIKYSSHYRTEDACQSFVDAIAISVKEEFFSRLNETKFVSLIYDAYSNLSESYHEALIYVQFVIEGTSYTYFVTKEKVKKSDSLEIYSILQKVFDMLGPTFKKKLVAIAIDGASINKDIIETVISYLHKDTCKGIVDIKCLIHRLEADCREAIRCPLFERVTTLLRSLYVYYKNPNHKASLEEAFKVLGESPVMPFKVRDSYWVSDTLTALNNLWKGYRAILIHLGQISDSDLTTKLKLLLKLLKSEAVIGFAHMLQDILVSLSNFFLELKKQDLTISKCCEQFGTLLAVLEELKHRSGYFLRRFSGRSKFQGQKLCGSFPQPDNTTGRLKEYLQKRFEDLSINLPASTSIVDLSVWPTALNAKSTREFGCDAIVHFKKQWKYALEANEVDVDVVNSEWNELKMGLIQDGYIHSKNWVRINRKYKSVYPNVLDLVDLLLCLPTSFSECSQGRLILEDMRKESFTVEQEISIIRIRLHSPDIEYFDPSSAIRLFNSPDFDGMNYNEEEPDILFKRDLCDDADDILDCAFDADLDLLQDDSVEMEKNESFTDDFQYRQLLDNA